MYTSAKAIYTRHSVLWVMDYLFALESSKLNIGMVPKDSLFVNYVILLSALVFIFYNRMISSFRE